jgi:hypothetical protein
MPRYHGANCGGMRRKTNKNARPVEGDTGRACLFPQSGTGQGRVGQRAATGVTSGVMRLTTTRLLSRSGS